MGLEKRCRAIAPQTDPVERNALLFFDKMSDDEFDEAIDALYSFNGGKRPPGTFKEALILFMRNTNISVEELAFQSKVSERTIGTMRNQDDYKPKLQTVISICIGLRLNPSYSYQLIELAGYRLTNSKQDVMYRYIIDKASEMSIEACNIFLKRANMEPL